jgi:thioredoxin-like negative regulator of GroEL
MSIGLSSSLLFTRLFLALVIAGTGLGFYWLVNHVILARAHSRNLGADIGQRGTPVLLYFTTPTCAPCKTMQRPAIQHLQEQVGARLQVVEVDASARPDLASQWGVLSVPTTFILDARGAPRHVNHGVATTDKLRQQIQDII